MRNLPLVRRCKQVAAALIAGVLATSPAHAQDLERIERIIVDGVVEVDGATLRRQSDDITAVRGSNQDPMPRFRGSICAGVWGLEPSNADHVIARIHANAERIGLDVDPEPGCKANVWAIFVDDSAATFESLRDDNNWMVRPLSRADRNMVEKEDGPARAWNLVSTRNAEDGSPVADGFEAAAGFALAQTLGRAPSANSVTRLSRLQTAVRKDIEYAVVLIDRSALADLDAFGLADYVTMRAFAKTREPRRVATYQTILNLFGDARSTDRITAFDIAYLRSLYRSSPTRPSRMAMSSLENLMEEELLSGAR